MKYKGYCQTACSAVRQLVNGNVCSDTKELTTGTEFQRFANTAYGEADHTICEASFFKRNQMVTVEEGCYDLYQRLQLQFYVLLMMGATDARNM